MSPNWRRGESAAVLSGAHAALKYALVAEDLRAAVFEAISDPSNQVTVLARLAKIPQRWQWRAFKAWRATRERAGWMQAHRDMAQISGAFGTIPPEVWQTDSSLADYAEACAAEVVDWLFSAGVRSDVGLLRELKHMAARRGVPAPDCKTLRGVVERMKDARWWRRAVRKSVIRTIEAAAIKLGYVHRRASLYASAETVARRGQQKRRNARTLAGLTLENESGQAFNVGELAETNVSNPAIRRAELMTRIKGFQNYAESKGHAALFFTLTAPSKFHARGAASGQANPKFAGASPRDAQSHLCRQWARARSRLGRLSIFPYGLRVAEPHHDGCPHWHLILFVHPECVEALVATLRRYAFQVDAGELSSEAAQRARFDWKVIDTENGRSGAAGYIAKYIAKNVDGFKVGLDDEGGGEDRAETVGNVDAWAATWGIRQFQQIGGPGVTVWREMRRLRESPQLPLFETFHAACNAGAWADYVALQGGIEIKRRDRPLALLKLHSDAENRYGEEVGEVVEGVRLPWKLERCRTRFHTWATPGEWARARGEHELSIPGADGKRPAVLGGVGSGNERRSEAGGRLGSGARVHAGESGAAEVGAGREGGFSDVPAVDLDSPWSRVNNCTRPVISTGSDWRAATLAALAASKGRAHAALERIRSFRASG